MNICGIEFVTKKPTTEERLDAVRTLTLLERLDKGKSKPFRLAVGDKVEDFFVFTPAEPVGTVKELYRENGHNRVATENGYFREQDLRRMQTKATG